MRGPGTPSVSHRVPRLLAAVILVEDPRLDPTARSPVGAVGLMQVMPFHEGQWGCPGDDLEDPDDNICHGARILAAALHASGGDLESALLRYNGCVRSRRAAGCLSYPRRVYGKAGPDGIEAIDAMGTTRVEPGASPGPANGHPSGPASQWLRAIGDERALRAERW